MKYIGIIILAIVFWRCDSSFANEEPKKEPTKEKVTLVTNQLPPQVREQSGMIWYNNLIWVINDSGGLPKLYAYNKNGKLKRTVNIGNIENIDWEALAADKNNFYIGDFGNNYGSRKNLRVLKISKSQIDNTALDKVNAEIIHFKWSDQTDFSKRRHRHNFDCESLFAYNNKLYLFSKNWDNYKTRIYELSTEAGTYSISPKATVNVNFMVTGADVSPDGKVVALVGYKAYKTYMYFFYDYHNFDFTKGATKRIYLEKLGTAQTEGVMFDNNNNLYINTERTESKRRQSQPQSLYQINWRSYLEKSDK